MLRISCVFLSCVVFFGRGLFLCLRNIINSVTLSFYFLSTSTLNGRRARMHIYYLLLLNAILCLFCCLATVLIVLFAVYSGVRSLTCHSRGSCCSIYCATRSRRLTSTSPYFYTQRKVFVFGREELSPNM